MKPFFRSALALFLALILGLSFAACSPDTPDTPDDTTSVPDTDPAPGSDSDQPDTPDRPENLLSVYVTAGAAEDGADGSAEHPFATLEAARDAVRAIERTDDLTGIQVLVSGTFRRTGTFELTKEDAGTELCPVHWIGTADGAAISGGVGFTRTDFEPANDDFSRYFDEAVRDKILKIDLKPYGVDPATTAFQDYTPGTLFTMNSFFSGDTRLTLARYPDGKFLNLGTPQNIEGMSWRFSYTAIHSERIRNWHDPDHVYFFGYPAVLWGADYGRITAFDTENSTMDVSTTGSYTVNKGMPFYWYNIPEELTEPGEYYITEDAVAYYYPLTEEDGWTVTYPVCGDVLLSADADYLFFEHITFEDCANQAFVIEGDHITIDGCTLRRTCSMNAATLTGEHNTVRDSEFCNFAFQGLTVTSGDVDTLTSTGTVVTNNYFHNFSESGATYCSALWVIGCGNEVSHNEFAFSNHEALALGGNNNIVEYNEFHDVCTFTDDAGAVYYGKSYDSYGNILRYNYFHDIGTIHKGDDLYSCGSSGIYWDGGLAGQTAYGNVFVNITGQAQQASGGADITITDDLFINCYCAVCHPQIYYDMIFKNKVELGFELLTPAQKHASEHPEIAEAFPTILQMNNDANENDPWFWAAPARATITGHVIFCEEGKEGTALDIGAKVYEWGTVENNRTVTYRAGEQPSVEDALAESGLDIPFDQIGRR